MIPNPEKLDLNDLKLHAARLGIALDKSDTAEKILDNIYKKTCRPKLVQPTFIIDYPAGMLPLAKRLADRPELVDAFQLVVGGVELVKAFSELNDPIDQKERFMGQEKTGKLGDKEAQPFDEDFIEAMEYGMPPAGGVGIGLDRLVMLLTDTHNIKEVIFFPTMRSKS
jgi:lysyl-tRNA synthetase class 2